MSGSAERWQCREPTASLGSCPSFQGAGGGVCGWAGGPTLPVSAERLPVRVCWWVCEKRFFGKRAGKPLTSSSCPTLGDGETEVRRGKDQEVNSRAGSPGPEQVPKGSAGQPNVDPRLWPRVLPRSGPPAVHKPQPHIQRVLEQSPTQGNPAIMHSKGREPSGQSVTFNPGARGHSGPQRTSGGPGLTRTTPPPTSNPRQPGRVRHSRTGASAVVASGPCPEHQAAPWASGVWLVATSTQLGSEGPRVPGAGHSHPHLTDNETASVWGPGTLAQPEAPGLQGILAGSRELWLSPQPTTPWLGGSGLGGSRPHLETL